MTRRTGDWYIELFHVTTGWTRYNKVPFATKKEAQRWRTEYLSGTTTDSRIVRVDSLKDTPSSASPRGGEMRVSDERAAEWKEHLTKVPPDGRTAAHNFAHDLLADRELWQEGVLRIKMSLRNLLDEGADDDYTRSVIISNINRALDLLERGEERLKDTP